MWLIGAVCIAIAAALMAWNMADEDRPKSTHPWLD